MRINFMARRKQEGLTQEELSEKLGVTTTYISYIETGRSDGSQKFWKRVQEIWNIENSDMYDYMQKTSNN